MFKRFVFTVPLALSVSLSFAQIEQVPNVALDNNPYPFLSSIERDSKPLNLLNNQLYCANDRHEKSSSFAGHAAIILTLTEDNIVGIEKLKKGTYYDVVEILSTSEQKENLVNTLKSAKTFAGDAVHYQMMDGKDREYKFKKKDIETLLSALSFSNYSKNVIYTLKDKSGKKYFLWFYRNSNASVRNKNVYVYLVYGDYANIQDFVAVSTFNFLKSEVEGKEIVDKDYYDNPFADKEKHIYIAEKILVQDQYLTMQLKKKSDGSEKMIKITDRANYPLSHHDDRILTYSTAYALRSDADSLFSKWEQEELQAEQEKFAKDAKRKQELVRKYGEKYAQDIADGKVTIGMSKDMCKAAIGTPDNITTGTNAFGRIEVWEYTKYHRYYPSLYPVIIVTFADDKVSEVNEYNDYLF